TADYRVKRRFQQRPDDCIGTSEELGEARRIVEHQPAPVSWLTASASERACRDLVAAVGMSSNAPLVRTSARIGLTADLNCDLVVEAENLLEPTLLSQLGSVPVHRLVHHKEVVADKRSHEQHDDYGRGYPAAAARLGSVIRSARRNGNTESG